METGYGQVEEGYGQNKSPHCKCGPCCPQALCLGSCVQSVVMVGIGQNKSCAQSSVLIRCYIHSYIHTYTHRHTHTYIHTCIHIRTAYMHTCMHTCIHTSMHTYIYTRNPHIHAHTNKHTHTYTHVNTHAYIYCILGHDDHRECD